jgi:hypothetical protein
MAKNCNHKFPDGGSAWKVRASGLKEHCLLCNVARKVGAGPCPVDGSDHDYQPGKSGKKEYCTKCGAGKQIINVRDSVIGSESSKVGVK